jgi:hypothetical protein
MWEKLCEDWRAEYPVNHRSLKQLREKVNRIRYDIRTAIRDLKLLKDRSAPRNSIAFMKAEMKVTKRLSAYDGLAKDLFNLGESDSDMQTVSGSATASTDPGIAPESSTMPVSLEHKMSSATSSSSAAFSSSSSSFQINDDRLLGQLIPKLTMSMNSLASSAGGMTRTTTQLFGTGAQLDTSSTDDPLPQFEQELFVLRSTLLVASQLVDQTLQCLKGQRTRPLDGVMMPDAVSSAPIAPEPNSDVNPNRAVQ